MTPGMKRVLVLSFSPIASDPRVMRQVRALEGRYRLTVAGYGPRPAGNFDFHDLAVAPPPLEGKLVKAALLLAGLHRAHDRWLPQARRARAALARERFDLVVANDLGALPVALEIAQGAPVLLDAHEFTPREFEDRWRWRLLAGRYYEALCRRALPRVAGMTTVCEGIAREYARYGVAPRVVMNCPEAQALPVRPVDPAHVRLVHHGIAVPSRSLEQTIAMMAHLDARYSLDLMLVESDPAYMRRLRALAAADPRIRFRAPVRMEEIAGAIHDYDIGVFLLPPVNFNYRMALPNKFFEFVQARLAVAIGPSPEMATLVRRWGFGIVADSFEPRELARRIAALAPADLLAMKQRSDVASRELNAAQVSQVFLAEVARLVR